MLETILLLGLFAKMILSLDIICVMYPFFDPNLSHTDYFVKLASSDFVFLFFVELWSLHSLFF